MCVFRTWTGPAWSPAQSISSVLISIQSLMTENPYHNEPGFEQVTFPALQISSGFVSGTVAMSAQTYWPMKRDATQSIVGV